ncbi:MAG: zinc-dependent alcohol dehydrogenase [Candidatus Fervidibacter sp.]|uniref:zinc-dependent alcohol dehydrogenase n=1 Tax=Candidatus Fervidibacter sp. TaxID=3100871 RepID=UPI004048FC50
MRAVQFQKSIVRYVIVKALGKMLPKVMTSPLGMVSLRELEPIKLPSPYWVRVKPKLCGICGSDLAVITAKSSLLLSPLTSTPFTFGHEVVGEVVEVGSAVTKVNVGDRVVVEPALSCFVREIAHPCQRCSEGNYACCERVTEGVISAGIQTGYCRDTGGGWSEELVAHEWQVFRVPDELDNDVAVLTEPLSCALHATLKALRLTTDDPQTALIIGCGTMGLLTIAALRFVERALSKKPLKIVAVAKYLHQADWAIRLGANETVKPDERLYERLSNLVEAKISRPELGKPTVLGGFDIVFDCVGSENSLGDSVRWTRANGVLAVVGMPAEPKVNWTSVWFKELKVIGTYAYGVEEWRGKRLRTFELAIDLLKTNTELLNGFVTHRFPLDQWQKAIQTALHAGKHGAIKVALYP